MLDPGVPARRCVSAGHVYGGPGGWRACACERAIPAHADTALDPAGGPGCGMVWRVCARCSHIDEHHITDHDAPGDDAGPAGRRLGNDQPTPDARAALATSKAWSA